MDLSSAVCIQAWFRGNYQRQRFQSAVRAFLVSVIQAWYRACSLRNAEQRRYLEMKSAVVSLQAAFRGWRVRREAGRRRHASAVLIQALWRAARVRSSIQKVMLVSSFHAFCTGLFFPFLVYRGISKVAN
uniref:Myosin motor domain-containing protein n=1 Tax=Electrophorus electricus TaxID=8005 RepID=A0AAY5EQ85_ELEEL